MLLVFFRGHHGGAFVERLDELQRLFFGGRHADDRAVLPYESVPVCFLVLNHISADCFFHIVKREISHHDPPLSVVPVVWFPASLPVHSLIRPGREHGSSAAEFFRLFLSFFAFRRGCPGRAAKE